MRILISLSLLLIISASGNSQSYLGTWTSYLPYNSATKVAVAGNKIYCTTNGGLLYYNKEDQSLNKLTKESGLSDIDITAIGFSQYSNATIIAYKNANLDIIYGNNIINLPDIMRKQVLGDKSIYDIHFRDNYAYLSCGFGIVVVNLSRNEISETYYIGDDGSSVKINAITTTNSYIYAATDQGLFYADINNSNLNDFHNWYKDPRFETEENEIKSITSDNNNIYISVKFSAAAGDSILYLNEGQWKTYPYIQSLSVPFLESVENELLVCSASDVDVFDTSGNHTRHYYVGQPLMAGIDNEENIWIADYKSGFQKFNYSNLKEFFIPEGPASSNIADMNYRNGKLICTAGGTTSTYNNLFRKAGYYIYENKEWNNYSIDSLRDYLKVIIDPDDINHFYITSWGYGLSEFQDNLLVNVYKENNSSLLSIFPGQNYIRLGGINYDYDGNLWITNSGVSNPLSVLSKDGNWISYDFDGLLDNSVIGDLIITQDNYIWIVLYNGKGLFLLDHNNTPENPDDDIYKKISIKDKNNDIITNYVYSIAEDREGNIWVGTDKGPVVFYSSYRAFEDNNFYANQIIIPRNDGTNNGDALLGTETITCIEVDGANRKWFGTKDGGAFLVSDDGLEQIHEFNASNSPLLSNSIYDIEINDETAEVFFATENGLISYISDATQPDDIFKDVYAFPNPVREDYQGDIIISGLMEDSFIKITDLNGNIVFETKSLGGQAIWNGKNFLDKRVATGVYLVFCASNDGTQTAVTKLLFIH